MDRVGRLYLAALKLASSHIKASVNINGQSLVLPVVEIRALLDSGKISHNDVGDLILEGNNLKDFDAWLSIIKDMAYLVDESRGRGSVE